MSEARTARLRIEPLGPDHAGELFPRIVDPRLFRYVPGEPRASAASLAELYARLQRGAPADSDEVWLNWALRRHDDGTCIGTLQATVVGGGTRAWIAYVLAPDAWGRGYAAEAAAWLIAELPRRHVNLERLDASVDARNAASIRVLERLGFRDIGTEPSELRGEPTTDHLYRLDWLR